MGARAMTALKRLPRWPDRLDAFIESRRNMPFSWGHSDCITFAAGAVEAITGAAVLTPTWTTALEAARVIEEEGGLTAAVSSRLGTPNQNWREIRRGDVALAQQDGRDVAMVCVGAQLCGPGVERLGFHPITMTRLFWKVG